MKIVHITPHLGGGVGRVVLNWIRKCLHNNKYEHQIVCLESANNSAKTICSEHKIPLSENLSCNPIELFNAMNHCDIVLVHWWNHPKLYDLLVNWNLPACRLLIWSHVSGFSAPQVFTEQLTKFPDIFVVSTPFSLESPVIQSAQNHNDKNNIRVIFTCAGSEHIPVRNAGKSDSQFIIGYVGTVDYCKLHPSFVRMSANANIPEAKFVVVGGDKHTQIARETIDSGYGDKFEFTGPVSNVAEYLAKFEIFGYPLSPDHYGTGEQALIEAMTAGIPVVVFNNGAEKHLVDNNVTGLIVDSEDQYTDALEKLYHDSDLRNKLSNNCRHYARDRFSIGTMIDAWQSLFDEVISYPKKAHLWLSPHTLTGADLFLESLGDSKNAFAVSKYNQYKKEKLEAEKVIAELKGAFASSTRGSPFHYRAHYPHDPYLNLWCGLIEMNMGLYQKALNSFMFAQKIESSRIAWYAADVLEHLKYSQSNSFYIRKPTAFRNEQAKLYNSASYESEEVCAYS